MHHGNQREQGKERQDAQVCESYLPEPIIDFFGMLSKQAEQTTAGVKALISGLMQVEAMNRSNVAREKVKGDQIRLEMESELQRAFTTPFE